MYARAVYLDDNTGRGGVIMCAVDCVGLSRADINKIRKIVIESGRIPNIKSINIAATHSHSAIDTQGLWGESFFKSGLNGAYMETFKQRTAAAIIAAYENRTGGKLYIGECETVDMQEDLRTPVDYSKTLTRIRFSPSDGSADTYIINYACHAELLGKNTTLVSADFPAYMIKEIERQADGANVAFFNGAIGGMISSKGIEKVYSEDGFDCVSYTKNYGKELGEYAMSISSEEELSALVNIKSSAISASCGNTSLVLARFLGILNNDAERTNFRSKTGIISEVSYLELGENQAGLFLIPGELYPELESGNFLPANEAANKVDADYKVLSQMSECKYRFVVGLCNDTLGYIVPDNDFMLHEWFPYFNIPRDENGREHYEETNSVGPETARTILEAMDSLIASAKG